MEIVRRGFEHFRKTRDFSDGTRSSELVWDMSKFNGWPEQQIYDGIEGAESFIRDWTSAFDDWTIELEDIRDAGDDKVVVVFHQRGHSKTTGMLVDMLLGAVYTVRGGRQIRVALYSNPSEALQAVGLEEWAMSQENAEPLRETMSAAQRAFNSGDFERAFAALAPDVEWHFGPWLFDAQVLRGRAEVIAFYSRLREAGAWQVEAVEIVDAGQGRFMTRQRGRFEGRTSKLTAEQESFLVWELGAGGLVERVREYETRAEALKAVGLEE
jgi:ketosteroid isomerase-like protein